MKSMIAFWYLLTCWACGREYLGRRPDKKTCGTACRKRYSRYVLGDRWKKEKGDCEDRFRREARAAGYGHHDDILFDLRTGKIEARPISNLK